MPLLALPLALIGLVALPALAAIYVLRTRYRRRAVSSLMLWNAAALATGGGRKANRLQTPWVLLLELLALLLLVLAATMPRWLATGQRAQVMVVLDNSWSMRAIDADGRSARDRGADALADELSTLGRYAAGFVLAGPKPQRLGDSARDAADVAAVLDRWTAEAPTADLNAALALARETGGEGARVVVVTDQAREVPTTGDQAEAELRWRAVGVAGDNAAVVRAVRRPGGAEHDAVMVEVARSGGAAGPARTVGVQIEAQQREALPPGTNPIDGFNDDAAWAIVARQRVALEPGQTKRVWLEGSDNTAGRVLRVSVTMPGDVLAADDRAWLAAADVRPVSVAVQVQDAALSAAVQAALQATGRTTPVAASDAELRVVDDTVRPAAADAPAVARRATDGRWVMRFLRPADDVASQAFLGPFLLDDAHPLTADAALAGVVWSALADPAAIGPWMRGADAVPASAGDVPLIGWFGGEATEIRVNVDAQRSTILNNVAFPVLMSNAVRARAAARPGVTPVNLPLGGVVALQADATRAETGDADAGVTTPPAATVQRVAGLGATDDAPPAPPIALSDGAAVWAPPRAGVYQVTLPGAKPQTVVVHGQSAAESDLSAALTADSGDLHADLLSRPEYRGLGWLLGLTALGLLGIEAWLLRAGAGVGAARSEAAA